jgi:hypothetical protein
MVINFISVERSPVGGFGAYQTGKNGKCNKNVNILGSQRSM